MASQIFINQPVNDLKKSIKFFSKLGFKFNKDFTDKNATCIVISDNIYVMLLVKKFFKTFTKKEIINSKKNIETILAITASSRKKVDEILIKVKTAGGKESRAPENHGWMYGRSFEDIDGHNWEVFYMDESKRNKYEEKIKK